MPVPKRNLWSGVICLLLSLVLCGAVYGQSGDSKAIDLGGATVMQVIQDQYGFLWIATDNGLWRYDGSLLINYQPLRYPGLPSSNIRCLTEIIERNEVWIGTQSGLSIYDQRRGTFRSWMFDESETPDLNSQVTDILRIGSDTVLILGSGLTIADLSGHQYSVIGIPTVPDAENISGQTTAVAIDRFRPGTWWIGTRRGLVKWERRSMRFERYVYSHPDPTIFRGSNSITSLVQPEADLIITGTYRMGLRRFEVKREQFLRTGFDRDWVIENVGRSSVASFLQKNERTVRVNFNNGNSFSYDFTRDTLLSIKKDLPLYTDREGNEYRRSVEGLELRRNPVRGYRFVESPALLKNSSTINELFEYQATGNLYVFHSGEPIFRYDPSADEWRPISVPRPAGSSFWFSIQDYHLLHPDTLLLLGHNRSWIFDLAGERLLPGNLPLYPGDYHSRILPVGEDSLLICSRDRGLSLVSGDSIRRLYTGELAREEAHHGTHVFFVFPDHEGNLWLRTRTGHSVIKSGGGVINYPYNVKPDSTYLGINDILEVKPGTIWCCEEGIGIIPYGEGAYGFDTILFRTGDATQRTFRDMELDEDGRVWCINDKEIMRIDPSTFETIRYPILIGFSRIKRSKLKLLDDGRMVLADKDGLIIFHPDSLRVPAVYNRPYIMRVAIHGEELNTDTSLFFGQVISLRPHENYLTIDFSSISYLHYPDVEYMYRMEGVDKYWVQAGSRNSVSYYHLPGGRYRFQLRSRSQAGDWSEPASWSFHIAVPFHKTPLFYLLLILALSGIIVWTYRQRVSVIRKKARERTQYDRKVAQLEMQALKARMSPHFIFNSLNSIQNLITQGKERPALRYLNKFSRLIREVLENSDKPEVPLEEEIETLRKYIELEELRFQPSFSYGIEVDPALLDRDICIPNMLIQPFIENAIHHGLVPKSEGRGRLVIRIQRRGRDLRIEVEDNGVGRDFSRKLAKQTGIPKGKSLGIEVTKARLRLVSDRPAEDVLQIIDMADPTGAPAGTKIIITLFNKLEE